MGSKYCHPVDGSAHTLHTAAFSQAHYGPCVREIPYNDTAPVPEDTHVVHIEAKYPADIPTPPGYSPSARIRATRQPSLTTTYALGYGSQSLLVEMSPEPRELNSACCNCFAGFAALVRKVSLSLYAASISTRCLQTTSRPADAQAWTMSQGICCSRSLPIDPSLQRRAASILRHTSTP